MNKIYLLLRQQIRVFFFSSIDSSYPFRVVWTMCLVNFELTFDRNTTPDVCHWTIINIVSSFVGLQLANQVIIIIKSHHNKLKSDWYYPTFKPTPSIADNCVLKVALVWSRTIFRLCQLIYVNSIEGHTNLMWDFDQVFEQSWKMVWNCVNNYP